MGTVKPRKADAQERQRRARRHRRAEAEKGARGVRLRANDPGVEAGGRQLRAAAPRPGSRIDQSHVRDFIIAMSVELAKLAYQNGFDALAVIFQMAREVAETERSASDEHLRRS
jgi:hypothetical protein